MSHLSEDKSRRRPKLALVGAKHFYFLSAFLSPTFFFNTFSSAIFNEIGILVLVSLLKKRVNMGPKI